MPPPNERSRARFRNQRPGRRPVTRYRRGLATAVTAALVSQATGRGATGVYLQAEDENAAARALYRRAGFADYHGYHYRVAPE